MFNMLLYVVVLWWFPVLAFLMVFSILTLWVADWIVWHFGEEEYVDRSEDWHL